MKEFVWIIYWSDSSPGFVDIDVCETEEIAKEYAESHIMENRMCYGNVTYKIEGLEVVGDGRLDIWHHRRI